MREMRDKEWRLTGLQTFGTYPAKMNGVFTVGDLKISFQNRTFERRNFIGRQPFEYQTDPARKIKTVLLSRYRNAAEERLALNELVSLVSDNIVEPEKQIIGIACRCLRRPSMSWIKFRKKSLVNLSIFLRFLYRKPCGTGYHRLVLYGQKDRIRGRQISLP